MVAPFKSDGTELQPMAQAGAPTTGTWAKGTIICDKDGKNWRCITSGTPGTWEGVSSTGETAGGDLSGSYPNPTVTQLRGGATLITAEGHLHYQTPVWDDATLSGMMIRFGATEPLIEVYRGGIRLRHWDIGDEGCENFHLRHRYKPSSSIYIHMHVKLRTGTVGTTAKVKFELELIKGQPNTVDTAPATVQKEFDISNLAQYTEGYLAFDATTMVGYNESSNISFRLKRIAASGNEYVDKLALVEMDAHYEAEKMGTKTQVPGSGP